MDNLAEAGIYMQGRGITSRHLTGVVSVLRDVMMHKKERRVTVSTGRLPDSKLCSRAHALPLASFQSMRPGLVKA
jgi:hypothetical protein